MDTREPEDLPDIGLLSELQPEIRRRLLTRGRFHDEEPEAHLVK